MKVFSYIHDGLGRSRNAQRAEAEGRFPLTRAVPQLRDLLKAKGIKKNLIECRIALELSWDGEWHHTGKYGKHTDYYSLAAAEKWLQSQNSEKSRNNSEKNENELLPIEMEEL